MRRIYFFVVLMLVAGSSWGQATEDVAVEVSATTSVTPPRITLHWKPIAYGAPTYSIWKKSKTATSWGLSIATTLPTTDSTFVDTAVIVDSAYEYLIEGISTSLISTGYIYAGIKAPAIHNKGTMIVLVDSTFVDSCAANINTLMNDLSGDGWQLIRHNFARTAADTDIKATLAYDYAVHANVKAALILGHLAVPYSGLFDTVIYPPDGHVPYHDGAWSADIFYSCLPGSGWTDVGTNILGSYTANQNSPGDGKWDQITIPTPAVLQLGRVDFYNMPDFAATEVQMMNNYLVRDHQYKMDSLSIIHRALINDNFGYFGGEAFAANGWRNFAPLVGRDSVEAIPFISSLASSSYQWAYGCGGGSFTSASGIGATTDFAANPVNGIFVMLFGSYFGDWNVQNNFLRAPLCASTPALTNCWAGRPNWFFHHMALGENIGYSALLAQNNSGLYQPTGYGNQFIHVALMGDLSLRTDYIQPVLNLTVSAPYHAGAVINWIASPDPAVIGYYVYRADSVYGYFQRLNNTMLPVTTTTYHDYTMTTGLKYYMVRPVKLQSTPSGAYYNLGVGAIDTVTITFSTLSTASIQSAFDVSVFPNPASDYLNASISCSNACTVTMYVVNEGGQVTNVATRQLHSGVNTFRLNTDHMAPGVYTLVVRDADGQVVKKWTKL